MTREELIASREYWISTVQLDLYNRIKDYLDKNDLTQTELADKLCVTKGYISQVLNGDFDHKISKLIELSLACDSIPLVFFVDKKAFMDNDARDMTYELFPVQRPKNMVYAHTPLYATQQVVADSESTGIDWQTQTSGAGIVVEK